jgi:hypothetical protein
LIGCTGSIGFCLSSSRATLVSPPLDVAKLLADITMIEASFKKDEKNERAFSNFITI